MALQHDKPVHLIINPHSGYGSERLLLVELRRRFLRERIELVEYTTVAPMDAMRRAREIASSAAAVMVWGGDGTVNEVSNGLAGSGVPILPCPAGTENLLAKELRIPKDADALVDILQQGVVVDCDIGNINGRNFLLIIGIGFDGEVVRRLAAIRTGHISHLSYFWPIWRTFWEHKYPRMKIRVDGQQVYDDYGLAFVGNISRYAVGLRLCRDARFDDGLLDLVVFGCREHSTLMLHAAWTLLRRHVLKGNVLYRQAKRIEIETERPVPSQVDGDPGPMTPLDIRVLDQKLKLIVPPEWVAQRK